jgi:membrane protease YdiL (CAAX protease family)
MTIFPAGVTAGVEHVIAVFLVVVAPWLAGRRARRLAKATDPQAKVRLFRRLVLRQLALAATICALWLVGGVPAARLGLSAPSSWWLASGAGIVIVGYLTRSALRLRRRAPEFRERMRERAGALLLPESPEEVRWFALVSLGSGLSEELAYRGFLFYYLGKYVPGAGQIELLALTSILFGVAHLYQGWRGIAATAVAGVVMGGLYVLSGSLLLPMLAHAFGNVRAAIIFWPGRGSGAGPDADASAAGVQGS